MITPRRTKLLRVPDLRAFQDVIVSIVETQDILRARSCAVVVPNYASAEQLRRTFEMRLLSPKIKCSLEHGVTAHVFPDIVSREAWYERMHSGLRNSPSRLSSRECEALFHSAVLDAIASGAPPPFEPRPRLVSEMVLLYESISRLGHSIDTFERLLVGELEPSEAFDRGANRLLRQTKFLVATFRAYQNRLTQTGKLDEASLRKLLLETSGEPVLSHLVVTVADQSADAFGFWPADFDLITRLPGLKRVDIVSTETVLATGFYERLYSLLPGLEEIKMGESMTRHPVLLTPTQDRSKPFFIRRDREEELRSIAKRVKALSLSSSQKNVNNEGYSPEHTAVVFQRPLPYLYLKRRTLEAVGVPSQAFNGTPLAAEPFAAVFDLVLSFVLSGFTRRTTLELLRSPRLRFEVNSNPVTPSDVTVLDRRLREIGYSGGGDHLCALAKKWSLVMDRSEAEFRGISAADSAAFKLSSLKHLACPTVHLDVLVDFLKCHHHKVSDQTAFLRRYERGRVAVLTLLRELKEAYVLHDGKKGTFADLVANIRRTIETSIFPSSSSLGGVNLVDARAARYGDFDEIWLVGVVQDDWPERPHRNIFYPPLLLNTLGWPRESDRLSGSRANFRDLLDLPNETVAISTFTLENDAIVPSSSLLDELTELPFVTKVETFCQTSLKNSNPAISSLDQDMFSDFGTPSDSWLALRMSRTSRSDPSFHGAISRDDYQPYAISAIERYLRCPFTFFAYDVIGLKAEPEDSPIMTSVSRGRLLHEIFKGFFSAWTRQEGGPVTSKNLAGATQCFQEITERFLLKLSEPDRTLERAHLLGSPTTVGLGERLLRLESEHPAKILDRLLEHVLEGDFVFVRNNTSRRIKLKGIADRIDLLADGSLRLIDYKLGRAPKSAHSVQLPIYGVCAEQQLSGRLGRQWQLTEAAYLAFGTRETFISLAANSSKLKEALEDGQRRFLRAIEGIESGNFPPRPAEPTLCRVCSYSKVCRKDYVRD